MQTVLTWVNQVREERGMPTIAELPCGEPGSSDGCVIANALSGTEFEPATCGHFTATLWRGGVREHYIDLPAFVSCFITDFDLGRLPQLIA
jgi:hypothetical protein